MSIVKGSSITIESFIDALNSLVIDKINNLFNDGAQQNRSMARNKVPFVNIDIDNNGTKMGVWLNTDGKILDTRPPEINLPYLPLRYSFKSPQGKYIVYPALSTKTQSNKKSIIKSYNKFSVDSAGKEVQSAVTETVSTNISVGRVLTYADVELLLKQILTELSFLRVLDLMLIYKRANGENYNDASIINHYNVSTIMEEDLYGNTGMMDDVPSEKNKPITAAAMNKVLNDLYNRLLKRFNTEKIIGFGITFCHSSCHCHSSGRSRR